MKKLKKLWIVLSLSLGISLVSSCSLLWPQKPEVIPPRPKLQQCSEDVGVTGTVNAQGNVELTMEAAKALKKWILDEVTCRKANELLLQAHIEKLENRLKVIGQ